MRHLLLSASLILASSAIAPHAGAKEKPEPKAAVPSPTGAPAKAPLDPAHDAADKMQKFYEATKDLHARFEQEQALAIGGTKKASGEVWLKKPGKMRWEYEKPEKKSMIADGKTLWVYEPEDEQAFKHDLGSSSLPSSVSFLLGKGRLSEEFDIALDAGDATIKPAPGDLLLKLVPKKPTAQYRYLMFVVDGKSYMVKETVVVDQQGGSNHMRFADVKTNQGVGDGKFSFSPPTGTRIIKP